MPSPTPPKRRRAFLDALRQTGNVAFSGRKSGLSSSVVYGLRHRDAAFAADWAEALTEGRAQAAKGIIAPILRRKGRRPLVIRESKSGRTCIMECQAGGWNEEVEARFLDELAKTGNVRGAARAISAAINTVYRRRGLYPAFAAAWDETKSMAVERLDYLLIRAGTNLLDPPEARVAADDPAMSVGDAIRVIQIHDARNRQAKASPGYKYRKPLSGDEIMAGLISEMAKVEGKGADNA